jgi:hypothetical protein
LQRALELLREELGEAHPAIPMTLKELALCAMLDISPRKGMLRKEEASRCASSFGRFFISRGCVLWKERAAWLARSEM